MAGWRAEGRRRRGGPGGFVLTEVLVAMVVLVVGLLGGAGLLRLAAREMALTAQAEAARWGVAALADSLVAGLAPSTGAREAPWGELRWVPSGQGVFIEALAVTEGGGDGRTLARLWLAAVAAPPDAGPP